uniref:Uncharacterized protein n=1 Tax=Anguilla anguilla TaxID=7936 RepID=A0A0E9V6U6_ANGAN
MNGAPRFTSRTPQASRLPVLLQEEDLRAAGARIRPAHSQNVNNDANRI